jgi:hypothetical protein
MKNKTIVRRKKFGSKQYIVSRCRRHFSNIHLLILLKRTRSIDYGEFNN